MNGFALTGGVHQDAKFHTGGESYRRKVFQGSRVNELRRCGSVMVR